MLNVQKKNRHLIRVPVREPMQAQLEQVHCDFKPECSGCTFAAHGFICWYSDGGCLKTALQRKREEGVAGTQST